MTLATILGILLGVCITATGLGICLYFKRKVHQERSYSVKDIESMYARSLYKEVVAVESMPTFPMGSASFDAVDDDGVPVIPAGLQHREFSAMPGYQSDTNTVGVGGVGSRDHGAGAGDSGVGEELSRQTSFAGTINSADKMTESASTQVTSAKRTVVTVNLNMKEKENIKLNIFMNKDQVGEKAEGEDEVREESSFPRGLTAKNSRKKSLEKKASTASGKPPLKRIKSAESGKAGRPKTPVKERLSTKSSVKRKASRSSKS